MSGLLTELINGTTFPGMVSEPFAVLIFGISLIVLTAGLRVFVSTKEDTADFKMDIENVIGGEK